MKVILSLHYHGAVPITFARVGDSDQTISVDPGGHAGEVDRPRPLHV